MSTEFKGLSLLFRGLPASRRSAALTQLAAERYEPVVNAIPDPFTAFIPDGVPREAADAIGRALLTSAARSAGSGIIPVTGDDLTGDSSLSSFEGDIDDGHATRLLGDGAVVVAKRRMTLPVPEFAVLAYIRNHLGGRVPSELVGSLNYPAALSGDAAYDRLHGDDTNNFLEGGLFSSLASMGKKLLPVVSSVMSSAAKLGGSSLGKLALKAGKFVPGLGQVINAAEMASSFFDSSDAAGKAAAGSSVSNSMTRALTGVLEKAKRKTTKKVLEDIPHLESVLDATYGPAALNSAMLHLLAQEGDFYSDILTGNVSGAPALTGDTCIGDWKEKAASLWDSTSDAFSQMLDNTRKAGSAAYTKLAPKVKSAYDTPWGKASLGAAGLAGTALLYMGASKLMKNRPERAGKRLTEAKKATAKKVETDQQILDSQTHNNVISPNPLASGSASGGPITPFPGLPLLPGMPGGSGTVALPSDSAIGKALPAAADVTSTFIKVPFTNSVIRLLSDEGAAMLNNWNTSLMRVNPAFLTGDMDDMGYSDLGATFLLHGFPLSSVTIVPKDNFPDYQSHVARKAPVTSPSLTRAIISALLKATDGSPGGPIMMIKTDADPLWVEWDPAKYDVDILDKQGRLLGDAGDEDADIAAMSPDSEGSTEPSDAYADSPTSEPSEDAPQDETPSTPDDTTLVTTSEGALMPGERTELVEDGETQRPIIINSTDGAGVTSPPRALIATARVAKGLKNLSKTALRAVANRQTVQGRVARHMLRKMLGKKAASKILDNKAAKAIRGVTNVISPTRLLATGASMLLRTKLGKSVETKANKAIKGLTSIFKKKRKKRRRG